MPRQFTIIRLKAKPGSGFVFLDEEKEAFVGNKTSVTPRSLTFWLPQLDPVAFRISNPREAAVSLVLNLLYRHSVVTKLCQQPLQIR